MGGFGAIGSPRRRNRAGDVDLDFSDVYQGGFDSSDESAGLDLSPVPDFSDVEGGSSSVSVPGVLAAGLPSLSDVGSALAPFFGGSNPLATLGGSAAAAGMGSGAVRAAKRLAKKFLGRGGGRRRMNPGNFRALHRSMRRLSAFEHAAKRVYKFTHPGAHRSGFKFRRRRRRR
jgi:hypothetical protein